MRDYSNESESKGIKMVHAFSNLNINLFLSLIKRIKVVIPLRKVTTFFICFISSESGIILHNLFIRFKLILLENNKSSNEVL